MNQYPDTPPQGRPYRPPHPPVDLARHLGNSPRVERPETGVHDQVHEEMAIKISQAVYTSADRDFAYRHSREYEFVALHGAGWRVAYELGWRKFRNRAAPS